MQGARSVSIAVATLAIACSGRPLEPARPPSTVGHNNVAGSDDEAPRAPPGGPTGEGGNRRVRTFDEAKRQLLHIYGEKSPRTDLYCGCTFLPQPGHGLRVDLDSCGYVPARDAERAKRIEWEHAVPAAAFGRTFPEWTEGSDRCVDPRGKRFKGRTCARHSAEFARIEADLHNLFPVVGEVNGLRGDLPMGLLEAPDRTPAHRRATADVFHFGACASAIERGVFLPRREVRGDLARAHRYMDAAYPERRLLDDEHRALFDRWSSEDPPDAWERERNARIAAVQGNPNAFIGEPSAEGR